MGPLTAAGVARVEPHDAGSASGMVNVAHQLGGSLGLGILVTVSAAASGNSTGFRQHFAHQVSVALTGSSVMLLLAFVVTVLLSRVRMGSPSGQSIYTAPGVEHWHGASPASFSVHLAIWEAPVDGGDETSWGEHVTDDEYDQHASARESVA